MKVLMVLQVIALICVISSMALYKRNLELIDMMKTPLLLFYRADVPKNQLYYLTQLDKIPQTNQYFRKDSVLPSF